MQQTIALEKFYPYPIERVWHALTDSKALASWLMKNDFEPRLGHSFQLQWRNPAEPSLEQETTIYCQVTVLKPPNQLAFTWREQWMDQPSIVTWELKTVEAGTQLSLCHSGLGTAISSQEFISPVYCWQRPIGQVQYDTQKAQAVGGMATFVLNFESEWEYWLIQLAEKMSDFKQLGF